ncbi:hypothetical protein BDF14DRAFT_1877599 [Spinellus fusiger]|nr:hypothetical protein BDF14DRAFT_1877599 [Spinellus fusiger]
MSEQEKIRAAISRQFIESGEKERMMQLLKERLTDAGWNDKLYAYCRGTVNESVKKEILTEIKKFLSENLE